ncbi:MAG: hypothetical protein ACRDYD_00960 [Acidimicrobiales bacterium]
MPSFDSLPHSLSLTRDSARAATRALAVVRAGLGVVALVAPAVLNVAWVGPLGKADGARVLGRAVGGRDLALAAGILLAMRHETPVRGWVEGAGLADAADLVATIVSFRSLPRSRRWLVAAMAAGGVGASRLLSKAVDAEPA